MSPGDPASRVAPDDLLVGGTCLGPPALIEPHRGDYLERPCRPGREPPRARGRPATAPSGSPRPRAASGRVEPRVREHACRGDQHSSTAATTSCGAARSRRVAGAGRRARPRREPHRRSAQRRSRPSAPSPSRHPHARAQPAKLANANGTSGERLARDGSDHRRHEDEEQQREPDDPELGQGLRHRRCVPLATGRSRAGLPPTPASRFRLPPRQPGARRRCPRPARQRPARPFDDRSKSRALLPVA